MTETGIPQEMKIGKIKFECGDTMVVLIPELRQDLVPFLTHAELNGIILLECRMAIHSALEKHRLDLNCTTVRSLTALLEESDTVFSISSLGSDRDIEAVKAWAKAWRKKLGV